MQISNFSADLNQVESFIDFVANLNFNDVLKEESQSKSAAILKVGELTYRVTDSDVSHFDQKSSDSNDESQSKIEIASDLQGSDTVREMIPSLLHLHITPVQPDSFIAQLPHNLSSFIQEVVTIVKQYNQKTNLHDYKFHFQKLNLDIILSKQDDVLKVVIQVGDKSLQHELNHERQQSMILFLNETLDTTNIEVEFDFLSQFSGESGEKNSDSDQSSNEDSDDEDSDNN